MTEMCVNCRSREVVIDDRCGPCAKRRRKRQNYRRNVHERAIGSAIKERRIKKRAMRQHTRRLRPCMTCRADWAMPGSELCVDCDALFSGKPYFSI